MSDRKLDAQLAEHLWECQIQRHQDKTLCNTDGHGYIYHDHTRDWNGAGLVIEKMRMHKKRFEVSITWLPITGRWAISFRDGKWNWSKGWSEATHESFPIAVALAALRALGVEVEA